ncbi:MAG: type II secretion system F family protein [Candidatus Marinimicrobia bacterium]|nr:type II secretion system F family protein [Candidatus Neomarinimicrobiota bacterium]MBL7022885.1 type II secretion system F family protein [Candidatus Neomarinimicrobiota bacterium]MBL7109204.1 type II secretion system F family protein [Candidatus Neomarinimicrobiota bacterium]
MPIFSYIIRTQDGVRKEGEIEANNRNEAAEELRSDKNIIIKLAQKDTSFDFLGPFLDRLQYQITRFRNRVPLSTLVFFTRQLSTMFSAGLTIERALYFLKSEEKNKKFKKYLKIIEENIRKGLLLSDALERHPGVFSNLYISLVRAGEVSGQLSQTLEELAQYLETVEDTQRKIKSAMYYPVFIIGFLFVMLIVTFTVIIPQFSAVYESLNAELPLYTQILINTGDWFQKNILSVLFLSFLGLGGIWLVTLTDAGRLIKDRFFMRIPIFGKLILQGILSKFCKTMGILLGSGVMVMDTMKLLEKVVENRVFELAIQKAGKEIENGTSISVAFRDTGIFPPIMIQLVSTGEETGEIDNLVLKASDFYTKQVNAIVDRLTSIIEPALIILVGAVIGLIVIVTYLPIFQFGNALAN